MKRNVSLNLLHQSIKRGRGVAQAEAEDSELPQPPSGAERTVFGLVSGLRGICQYPLCRSKKENHNEPETRFNDLSMRGSGYQSFFVTLFRGLYSLQNLFFVLFFLLTITTSEA